MTHPFKNLLGYHGVANELDETDERLPKYKEQYDRQGWDDTVTWNLNYEIIEFILPKLIRFRELTNGYPPRFTSFEEWKDAIWDMICWMQLFSDDKISYTTEEKAIMAKGYALFMENFGSLWW